MQSTEKGQFFSLHCVHSATGTLSTILRYDEGQSGDVGFKSFRGGEGVHNACIYSNYVEFLGDIITVPCPIVAYAWHHVTVFKIFFYRCYCDSSVDQTLQAHLYSFCGVPSTCNN